MMDQWCSPATRPSARTWCTWQKMRTLVHEVIDEDWAGQLFPLPRSEAQEGLYQHLIQVHTLKSEVGTIAAHANVKTLVLSHLVPVIQSESAWAACCRGIQGPAGRRARPGRHRHRHVGVAGGVRDCGLGPARCRSLSYEAPAMGPAKTGRCRASRGAQPWTSRNARLKLAGWRYPTSPRPQRWLSRGSVAAPPLPLRNGVGGSTPKTPPPEEANSLCT